VTETQTNQARIAVVTGGSSGIGRDAALRLAQRGLRVVLTFNTNADGALEAVRSIEAAGGIAAAVALDLGDVETFPAFTARVQELSEVWGRATFDALINNAGASVGIAPFADVTPAMLDDAYRLLFKAPYLLTQALVPFLADNSSIVNVSSTAGLATGIAQDCTAYGAMKAAISIWTRTLAKELSTRGIRVNAVAPGPTATRFGRSEVPADQRAPDPDGVAAIMAGVTSRIALGRFGTSDDVGRLIAVLASDDGSWMTGETLNVSGGFGL
jgi:NAD(P)-dependent dehydrogenase (short-subunit alcohol dehydrogenase family)